MNQTNGVQVSTKIPIRTVEKLDKMVADGRALNRSDAVRIIIRDAVDKGEIND